MNTKRITIQDIADELGLSRNTISKAINGTGNVSDKTKDLIFQKAKEMGYKQFGLLSQPTPSIEVPQKIASNREIALFTCSIPGTQHLSSTLLDSFQKKISNLGYRLTIYMLRDSVISSCSFPENFNATHTDGILILELFDKAYTNFLCNQNIPTLFVDSYANTDYKTIESDLLYLENKNSSFQIVQHLLDLGCKKIGFVGDSLHCQSFYERWTAFRDAMEKNKNTSYQEYSILADDSCPYGNSLWLSEQIKNLPQLPDAFFCANDFLAICTIKALKQLNCNLPETVKIAGFDGSPESKIIEPALTTATIYGHEMGYLATDLLLKRIKYPEAPFTILYTSTQVVYRNSTEG